MKDESFTDKYIHSNTVFFKTSTFLFKKENTKRKLLTISGEMTNKILILFFK